MHFQCHSTATLPRVALTKNIVTLSHTCTHTHIQTMSSGSNNKRFVCMCIISAKCCNKNNTSQTGGCLARCWFALLLQALRLPHGCYGYLKLLFLSFNCFCFISVPFPSCFAGNSHYCEWVAFSCRLFVLVLFLYLVLVNLF